MKRSSRFIKRGLALVLVLLLSIESFAAVVGDNDGAAFITKAEFDSLKNDFQSQLDSYNSSLDNKVDGAIAAYLAGIRMSKVTEIKRDSTTGYVFPLTMFFGDSKWNDPYSDYYDLSFPMIDQSSNQVNIMSGSGNYMEATYTNNRATASTLTLPTRTDKNPRVVVYYNDMGPKLNGYEGTLIQVKKSNMTKNYGGRTWPVFDRVAFGIGNQRIFFKNSLALQKQRNVGNFGVSGVSTYRYYQLLGKAYGDINVTNTNYEPITQSNMHGSGGGAGVSATQLNNDVAYMPIGHRRLWADRPSAGWQTNTTIDLSGGINTAVFSWNQISSMKHCYAGGAPIHAQTEGLFAYMPDFSKGNNTEVEVVQRWDHGFTPAFWINTGDTEITTGTFIASTWLFMPPVSALLYDLDDVDAGFSSLPSAVVRYYDEDGKEHFYDEGMFLKNLNEPCDISFKLKFGSNVTSKKVKFYVSTRPFSSENMKNHLYDYRINNGTLTYNNYQMDTGVVYQVNVDDLQNGDQLYIAWEPVNSNDYVYLENFAEFYMAS